MKKSWKGPSQEELGSMRKRNLSERQGLERKWEILRLFFAAETCRRQRSHGHVPMIRFLEYKRVQCKTETGTYLGYAVEPKYYRGCVQVSS